MRWPFRRRGRHAAGRVVFIGGSPFPEPAPPTPEPPPPAVPEPAPHHDSVRLGFADGSEVALRADDPTAQALQAVADILAGRSTSPDGPFS